MCIVWLPSFALAESITGRCTSVTDGDTVQLTTASKTTYKIRLNGIDAPEKNQAFGQKAKQALSDLCFGKQIRAEIHDRDRYSRSVADIYDGATWINADLVKNGFAWHYKQYSQDASLAALEVEAKASKRGLWADPVPTAPWDFRHGTKNTNTGEAIREFTPSPVIKAGCGPCKIYKTCAEARTALTAGCSKLDGDGDGEPCESLCRP